MMLLAPDRSPGFARRSRALAAAVTLVVALPSQASSQSAQLADSLRIDSTRVTQLPVVVVTATRTPVSTFNSPIAVGVLSSTYLRERSPNSPTSLFRELPGLDVNGVGTNQVRPTIRGQRGQRILLLEDGIRMNNSRRQQDFGELPSLVSVSDLDRVEVVRGPSSVLYGSDAIGGVVNLITREASDVQDGAMRGSAEYLYSSADNQRRFSAMVAQRLGALSFRLSGTGRSSDPYVAPRGSFGDVTLADDERVSDSGVRDASVSALLGYELGSRSSLTARYERYVARDNGFGYVDPAALGEYQPSIRITYPDQEVNKFSLRYRAAALHGRFADRVEVAAYGVDNERDLAMDIFVPFGAGTPEGAGVSVKSLNFTDIQTIGARVEATKALGQHRLTYGVDAFRDRTLNTDSSTTVVLGFGPPRPSTSTTPQVPNASLRSLGVFAQGDIAVAAPLSLIVGARAQDVAAHPRAGTVESAAAMKSRNSTAVGNVNAIYRLGSDVSFIVSVGRAFRAPNLVERFFDGPTPEGSGYQRANPALDPETSLNLDGGVRIRTGGLALEGFVFQNNVRHGIRVAATGDSVNRQPVYQNVNVDHLRFSGFEIDASYLLARTWTLSANHSRLRSRNVGDAASIIGTSYSSKSVGELTFRPSGGRSWVSYSVRHNGRVQDDQNAASVVGSTLPAFTVQTLRAGTRLVEYGAVRGTLVLAVENLANVLYAEPSNASFFRPEPGRNIQLKWVVDF